MTSAVKIPVTLCIPASFPEHQPADAQSAAATSATLAAEHFAHVSQARIAAFNEVNRIHPNSAGVIETVISALDTAVMCAA